MKNEQILQLVKESTKKFHEIINKGIKNTELKSNVLKLIEDLGSTLHFSPASTNENYHDCYPGGYIVHSVQVFKNLVALTKVFTNNEYTLDELIIVGLFHDIGKVCSIDLEPYYIENDIDWQVRKGQLYKINDKIPQISHSARSIILLSRYNIKLTEEQSQSILYHDGQYLDDNKCVKNKEMPLTLLLHWADMVAVQQSKGNMILNING